MFSSARVFLEEGGKCDHMKILRGTKGRRSEEAQMRRCRRGVKSGWVCGGGEQAMGEGGQAGYQWGMVSAAEAEGKANILIKLPEAKSH
uniref:Uncharacterized protein n=1 Tax=Knipowitschia caucasica TaxID=637954 RepID=A0AAV2KC00_KNICA